MSDIAQLIGVSQATVSLVLNEASGTRFSQETRTRVLAAAKQLGYQRPGAAKTAGRVIGVLIDDVITTPHAAGLIEGIREEAAASGLLAMIVPTLGLPEVEADALDYLIGRPLAGVIYASLIAREVKPPERLRDVPTVLLNCYSPEDPFPSIVPGDLNGGFAATSLLLDAGHRRVAMLNSESWLPAAHDRFRGYSRALVTRDIEVDPTLVASEGPDAVRIREQTLRLLDLPDPPTAFFCFADHYAIGAYQAIYSRGMKVPDDVSIVGFDNEKFAADMIPPLTTLILPHQEMGRLAVERLLDPQGGSSTYSRQRRIKVECAVVSRESVAPPRNTPHSSPGGAREDSRSDAAKMSGRRKRTARGATDSD